MSRGGGLQAASICTSVLIIIHKVKEVFFQFSVSVAVKLQSVQFNVVKEEIFLTLPP